jgi:hypothetical protein
VGGDEQEKTTAKTTLVVGVCGEYRPVFAVASGICIADWQWSTGINIAGNDY